MQTESWKHVGIGRVGAGDYLNAGAFHSTDHINEFLKDSPSARIVFRSSALESEGIRSPHRVSQVTRNVPEPRIISEIGVAYKENGATQCLPLFFRLGMQTSPTTQQTRPPGTSTRAHSRHTWSNSDRNRS